MKLLLPSRKVPAILGSASLLALALTAVSCGERNTYVKPPPPEVEVVNPIVGLVAVPREAPGRTRAFARAEIRARVQGFLQQPDFVPGTFVKKDQILFRIERDEFEAAVTAAEGELKAATAEQELAAINYDRRKTASESGGVSKLDVANALAELKAADATVEIKDAAKKDALRALSYTELKSPIDGRVSQTLVDVGNLVGADGPTLLTTVIQDDPIYVDFEANEREILKHMAGRPDADSDGYGEEIKSMEVRLTLSDGSKYDSTGRLDFLDNEVDPQTGTMKARAKFDNPDGALASGMFVRISMDDEVPDAIQVPAIAIQRDLGGAYVIVVGADNVAERKPVEETRHVLGDSVVLSSGLTAVDQVIVTNLQRARPGVTVVVVEARATADAPDAPDAPEDASKEASKEASKTEAEAAKAEKPAAPAAPEETPAKADAAAKP